MELKLVYRVLRQLSQCSLNFYSEILVEGQENVPPSGPVILVACHPNEIMDIATLAVTIPHSRSIGFWAKASLFKNPVLRAILESASSIPVHRSSIKAEQGSPAEGPPKDHTQYLFRETFASLSAGGVIGLFPEGTSYTHPHLPALKTGAARVILEYARWQMENNQKESTKPLVVVPVGIVYTDKSRYRSKVALPRYGRPIHYDGIAKLYLAPSDNVPHSSELEQVKRLTAEIERCMRELTLNAPSWDDLHCATIARDIIFERLELSLQQYLSVTQGLIDHVSNSALVNSEARTVLLGYHSLLYHTGISHSALVNLYPTMKFPSRYEALSVFLKQLRDTVLHPRFWFFLPPCFVFAPAYIVGFLGKRYLGSPVGQETWAQFKAVLGGLAFGITSVLLSRKLASMVSVYLPTVIWSSSVPSVPLPSYAGSTIALAGTVAVAYVSTHAFLRWQDALVAGT
ncbi:hypothetical protein K474DRAFT_1591327 [Panus rudis PR-1116 ss-1]|nr:hypothetical protein K474DRAFT_1591327 [Panus rudis PR-1116 ss-1]